MTLTISKLLSTSQRPGLYQLYTVSLVPHCRSYLHTGLGSWAYMFSTITSHQLTHVCMHSYITVLAQYTLKHQQGATPTNIPPSPPNHHYHTWPPSPPLPNFTGFSTTPSLTFSLHLCFFSVWILLPNFNAPGPTYMYPSHVTFPSFQHTSPPHTYK